MSKTKELSFLGINNNYYILTFETSRIVCPSCDGNGTELRGGLKNMDFSPEHMNENPEFAESYFRGDYDVACSHCKGRNVVDEIDISALDSVLTSEQKEDYGRYIDEESAAYWEAEGERRMGA